jgi:2-polyprenyl-6-methoxyphenol hydroxylase-like FAD-dependent oxidoreductase
MARTWVLASLAACALTLGACSKQAESNPNAPGNPGTGNATVTSQPAAPDGPPGGSSGAAGSAPQTGSSGGDVVPGTTGKGTAEIGGRSQPAAPGVGLNGGLDSGGTVAGSSPAGSSTSAPAGAGPGSSVAGSGSSNTTSGSAVGQRCAQVLSTPSTSFSTRCCIAGAGPAGLMLALLLARAGVDVIVLEKHADFLRDFRGDTVHPSTLQVLEELGMLQEFLQRPHDRVEELRVTVGEEEAVIADFRRLRTRCPFIAMVPQWDFLDFLRDHAALYPWFHLLLRTEARELLHQDGRVIGVLAGGPEGQIEIRADLVVGCDGRHSTLRRSGGLAVRELGAPIDVLWLRLSRHPGDPAGSGGRIGAGRFMALIDRGSYWQCAFVIPKGGVDSLRQRGIAAFREEVVQLVPWFADRVEVELSDWEAVKLLSVSVDRLERWWRPGLLCIGDAAHAMSPIGGVGINLAVQDAVAAANILAAPLADGKVRDLTPWLRQVQRRRLWPTRVIQAAQVAAQDRLLRPLLDSPAAPRLPLVLRLLNRFPALRAIPAYAVGVGVRPEHVHTPERLPAQRLSEG